MSSSYSTRNEAIDHEIVEPIEAGDATAADFDIEAIADQVLTTTGEGAQYRWALRDDIDEDTFWGIVADNAADQDTKDHIMNAETLDPHTHILIAPDTDDEERIEVGWHEDEAEWLAAADKALADAGFKRTSDISASGDFTVERA